MTPKHEIDATKITIGRVASRAASLLLGKNNPSAARNAVTDVKVSIINAGKSAITEKKMDEKEYVTYSGYPRGIHYRTLAHTIDKKGVKEAIRTAVFGMLPKNTLRSRIIKNLTISE